MPARRSPWLRRLFPPLLLLALLVPQISLNAQVQEGATMTVLRGQVAVVHPDSSAFQPAPSGTTVFAGDEIRTLTASGALITFFSGIEIEMGSDTVLAVERVSKQGDRVDISLKQVFGDTLSRVQTFTDPNSSYQILAGGAVAAVRGTKNAISVRPPVAAIVCIEDVTLINGRPCRPGQAFWWTYDPKTGTQTSGFNATGTGGFNPVNDPFNAAVDAVSHGDEDHTPPGKGGKDEDDTGGPPAAPPPPPPAGPTGTPTPTQPAAATATATITPTPTATTTSTPTITPTITVTPTPTCCIG